MPRRRWIYYITAAIACIMLALLAGWMRIAYPLYELNLRARVKLAPMDTPRPGQKILIFAPHEDDETLGAGGYIQQAVAAKSEIKVVLMTNGEYPEIDAVLFEEMLRARPESYIKLGYIRQKETLNALNYLEVPPKSATFLGYPNQFLDQMWEPRHWLPSDPVMSIRTRATRSPYDNSFTPHAVYCGQSMLRDVENILLRYKPDVVITVHPSDVHVDHWPTGAVVTFALNELSAQGEEFAGKCRLYRYLIHRDFWPAPRGYRPWLRLLPPQALASATGTDWLARDLTPEQVTVKANAIALYRTQGGGFDPLLRAFARKNDLFGVTTVRNWPNQSSMTAAVVSQSPIADTRSAAANPAADITLVSFGLKNGRLWASITTKGNASPRTGYHFSVHAGGSADADRTMAEYDWHGDTASGWIVRDAKLRRISSRALKASVSANESTLDAPWPLSDSKPTFFMIRAWTTRSALTLDSTAEATFRINNP